jgi:uncharacterized protein (DUF2126 family)
VSRLEETFAFQAQALDGQPVPYWRVSLGWADTGRDSWTCSTQAAARKLATLEAKRLEQETGQRPRIVDESDGLQEWQEREARLARARGACVTP